MKQFTYTITDPLGIHARPAGMLAKAGKDWPDTVITINKRDNAAKATQMMKLMSMGIKLGDEITVTAEGPQESAAIDAMQSFFRNNL